MGPSVHWNYMSVSSGLVYAGQVFLGDEPTLMASYPVGPST